MPVHVYDSHVLRQREVDGGHACDLIDGVDIDDFPNKGLFDNTE